MFPTSLPSSIRLSHTGYVDHREVRSPERKEILKNDCVLRMGRGVHFTCVVSNEQGIPLPEAQVKLDTPHTARWTFGRFAFQCSIYAKRQFPEVEEQLMRKVWNPNFSTKLTNYYNLDVIIGTIRP